ncbi:MAG: ribosomal protein L23/L15e core domain-containing protein [Olpidium bornovanus]|uniref:Ribosomal protein L23/L15e core domain-containing protein n=1 Tax=Olpidium bornovanus TaxID=278681 RepID=A0A8H8A2D3_9FUNG|nr:MAG: ribosomal protein L23/L15e core domain-containing protein [Olpidium bornovanus]
METFGCFHVRANPRTVGERAQPLGFHTSDPAVIQTAAFRPPIVGCGCLALAVASRLLSLKRASPPSASKAPKEKSGAAPKDGKPKGAAAPKGGKGAAASKPSDEKKKALTAKKGALTGVSHRKKLRKIRTSVRFHRPKTLRLPRNPKYPRKSVPHDPRMDQYRILKQPLNTETAMKVIEEHNTLVFYVDVRANKHQIKAAIKRMYDVDALKINTLIRWVSFDRPDGQKKAYVRLTPDVEALEVANKIRSAKIDK